jgi:hypothetical protein
MEWMNQFDFFCQIIITGTGCYSLLAIGSPDPNVRLNGGIVGLIGQPFWLATSLINSQYGLLILVIVYAISWVRVIRTSYKQIESDKLRRVGI